MSVIVWPWGDLLSPHSLSATCTYFGVSSCEAVIRGLIYRFMTRVDRSSNAIMSAICLSSLRYRSRIRRTWIGRLYTTVDAGVTWLTQAGRYVFMSFCVCVCVFFISFLYGLVSGINVSVCLSVCLTLCDVLSPCLTLCDIFSPFLTLCDLFGPYLTLCDLVTSGMTLSDPEVTSSLLFWPCVTFSAPIWSCVTSSLLVWTCVTLWGIVSVSQNWQLWVGNNTLWILFFHSFRLISLCNFHSQCLIHWK